MPATLSWLADIENKAAANKGIAALIPGLVKRDPERAVDVVLEQMTGDARAAALQDTIGAWAKQDLAAAVATAERLTAGGGDAGAVIPTLVGVWSDRDPAAAGAWLLQHDDHPEVRIAAFDALAVRWVRADPLAASQWIDRLPASPGRDRSSARLTQAIVHLDPVAAFAWAEQIQDPDVQRSPLLEAIHRWREIDPDAADAALAAAEIPDRTRLYLQEFIAERESGVAHR